MDKQATLGFILIFIVLMVWLYISAPTPPPPTDKTQQNDTTIVNQDTASPTPARTQTKTDAKKIVEPTEDFGHFFDLPTATPQIITIETDLAIIEMTTNGGKFHKYYLKNFNNWYIHDLPEDASPIEKYIQLLNFSKSGSFDIEFITTDGKSISTGDLIFNTDATNYYYKLTGDDSLNIKFSVPAGENGEIVKHYTIFGNKYDSEFDLELINMGNIISNKTYDVVWNAGIRSVEENSADESLFANSSVFYGGEKVKLDAAKFDQTYEEDFNGQVDWVAVRNKYFVAIMIPHSPEKVNGAYLHGTSEPRPNNGINEFYAAGFKMPFNNEANLKKSFTIYLGPIDYNILKAHGKNLDKIVDFGSFLGLKFIIRPIAEYVLLPLFKFLHSFIPNYGLVIIVFSLIIKLAVHPLTKSTYTSMKRMQLLQPKIQELKEKFKDDPQKINKETMKLYSTYGVNPAGGCLPMLLQMPIFIALWGMFQAAVELRQQPFIWWITDLSRPDTIFHLGFKIPLFGVDTVAGLALLMGVTTFVQQKMTIKDPQQQALIYIMPVMLTILFMTFPSGLNLYYFMFNLLSIAHQHYINKYSKSVELVPVANPNKKKGFMQRMMDAAEKQSKQTQNKGKKK
ncbi:MAG: preprotein translocase YidC [Chlorobiaceae bacterium]|nr:preprotein translocase YidC [Chlorobiaceae bacterium]MBA4310189.1 preprotein translocase YidC [Chlorobiaceae bacterium]